jgi:hypothetical protein
MAVSEGGRAGGRERGAARCRWAGHTCTQLGGPPTPRAAPPTCALPLPALPRPLPPSPPVQAVVLRQHPGSTIVTDSVTSDGLTAFIGRLGGKHLRWGHWTGHLRLPPPQATAGRPPPLPAAANPCAPRPRSYMRGYKNVIGKGQALNVEGVDCALAMVRRGSRGLRGVRVAGAGGQTRGTARPPAGAWEQVRPQLSCCASRPGLAPAAPLRRPAGTVRTGGLWGRRVGRARAAGAQPRRSACLLAAGPLVCPDSPRSNWWLDDGAYSAVKVGGRAEGGGGRGGRTWAQTGGHAAVKGRGPGSCAPFPLLTAGHHRALPPHGPGRLAIGPAGRAARARRQPGVRGVGVGLGEEA